MSSFDTLAPTYDDDFTHSLIGQHLRNRVQHRLLELWRSGDHILELGCGTGEDALYLGSHSIAVTATDVSQNMLDIALHKTSHLGNVTLQQLDLAKLDDNLFDSQFDGVLSNFGALNCIADWQPLAEWLSKRVKTGGTLAFAMMSPYCFWETLWHGFHLDFGTAFRRWKTSALFEPDDKTSLNIYSPSIKRITNDFTHYFVRSQVKPLGLFLPPSDVYPVIEKRRKLLHWLTRTDDAFANVSQLALFADHYWIEFKRI